MKITENMVSEISIQAQGADISVRYEDDSVTQEFRFTDVNDHQIDLVIHPNGKIMLALPHEDPYDGVDLVLGYETQVFASMLSTVIAIGIGLRISAQAGN